MFCPNCGNEMPNGSKFCPNCGKAATSNTGFKKYVPLIIGIAGVIIAAAIILVVIFRDRTHAVTQPEVSEQPSEMISAELDEPASDGPNETASTEPEENEEDYGERVSMGVLFDEYCGVYRDEEAGTAIWIGYSTDDGGMICGVFPPEVLEPATVRVDTLGKNSAGEWEFSGEDSYYRVTFSFDTSGDYPYRTMLVKVHDLYGFVPDQYYFAEPSVGGSDPHEWITFDPTDIYTQGTGDAIGPDAPPTDNDIIRDFYQGAYIDRNGNCMYIGFVNDVPRVTLYVVDSGELETIEVIIYSITYDEFGFQILSGNDYELLGGSVPYYSIDMNWSSDYEFIGTIVETMAGEDMYFGFVPVDEALLPFSNPYG